MIEIVVCTIDSGIQAAAHVPLPPQQDVCYLVSWQQTTDEPMEVPAALTGREDVRIVTMKGRGLSANRNNALEHARGDILLFADDDCRYRPEYFERVRQAFAAHPEADVITFQALTTDYRPMRRYPATAYTYDERPRGSYVVSFEIACRREPHGAALPRFDERFGLGSGLFGCGEEEVFVHEAHTMGLTVRYEPTVVVEAAPSTTGRRFLTDPSVQRAKGAVLCLMHGAMSARLRCLKAALLLPRGAHRWRVLKEMWRGVRAQGIASRATQGTQASRL